jgi:hypothetical protein
VDRTRALALVIALAAVGLVATALGLRFRLGDEAIQVRENTQWVVTQARVEHLRVLLEAMRVQAGESDADALSTRFEIFAGRMITLAKAPILNELRLEPAVADALVRAQAAVAAVDRLGASGDPAAIRTHLEPLEGSFQEAVLGALAFAVDRQQRHYDALTDLIPTGMVLVAGTLTANAGTISHLGTQDFARLRIGIGAPADNPAERRARTVGHVLGRFSAAEQPLLQAVLTEVEAGIGLIQRLGLERAGNRLNSFQPEGAAA